MTIRKLAMLLACAFLHDRPELARRVVLTILLVSLAVHGGMQPYGARVTELSQRKCTGRW